MSCAASATVRAVAAAVSAITEVAGNTGQMRVPAVAAWRSLLCATVLIAPTAGAAASGAASASASASAATSVIQGADISWPNCPKGEGIPSRRSPGEPLPLPSAQFVVIGLTNGPGFYPNPCLSSQLGWARRHHELIAAYALTTYPTRSEIAEYGATGPYRSALKNTAYAEAQYNLSTASAVGLTVPMIWVDVEPYPVAPWSHNLSRNRQVVDAVVTAYQSAGYQVGIYTNPNGWPEVVGNGQLPALPSWSTIGAGHLPAAHRQCSRGPSGGADWMVQWWIGPRDHDVLCPAGRRHLSNIFAATS